MSSRKAYSFPLTVFCFGCKHEMSCPSNAAIIQCSKCYMILDPYYEYNIKCNGCNHILTHPITARIIQCPLCSIFMDVSHPDLPIMDLIEHRKSKKRKLSDTNFENEDITTSDSNTTVSTQTIEQIEQRKRRKLGNMEMYNEQWIEYESNQIHGFKPNRPCNASNDNLINIKLKNAEQSKSDFFKSQKKKKKKKINNSKYGSFQMTPITFI